MIPEEVKMKDCHYHWLRAEILQDRFKSLAKHKLCKIFIKLTASYTNSDYCTPDATFWFVGDKTKETGSTFCTRHAKMVEEFYKKLDIESEVMEVG